MNMARPEGTVLRERYVIKKYVGYGGFSIVYDAEDSLTGKRVAVKECTNDEFNEKFLQEARLLAGFSDEPAIVSVIDSFIEDCTAFIVMEFLEGKTLRETVKDDGVWSMEDTLHRLSDVMKTVEHINKNGVIHRDISPDNLMVMPDGSIKLLDFGAAREFEKVTVSKLVYKPNFSPPEQVDEKGTMGAWSDVYSMCATMYYCITGDNPEDVISRLLFDELKLPSEYGADIQPEAEKLLMKGLELESEKRIQNMGILRSGLEEIYRVLTEEELAAIAAEKRRRLIRRLSIAAGILLATAAFFYVFRVNIYFLMNESDTLTLDGRGMTAAEYGQSSAAVKDRFKTLTDGYYLWNEKDGIIDVTIPHKIMETCVPDGSNLRDYILDNVINAGMNETPPADVPEKRFRLIWTLFNMTEWEDPAKSPAAGKFQVKESEIESEGGDSSKGIFLYNNDSSDQAAADMKKLLDAAGVPYAIGKLKTDLSVGSKEDYICIEYPMEKIGLEVLKLFDTLYPAVGFSDGARSYDISIYSDKPEFTKDGDGNYSVDIKTIDDEEEQNGIREVLDKIEKSGSEYVYLRYSSYDIARVSISDARKMLDKNGHIIFSDWCVTDEGRDMIPQFCEFVNASGGAFPVCVTTAWQSKAPEKNQVLMYAPIIFSSEKETYDYGDSLADKYAGEFDIEYSMDSKPGKEGYSRNFRIWMPEDGDLSIEESIRRFSAFIKDQNSELKKHGVDRISLIPGSGGILLNLQLFDGSDEYQITDFPEDFSLFTEEELEAANAAVKKDPVLGSLKIKK